MPRNLEEGPSAPDFFNATNIVHVQDPAPRAFEVTPADSDLTIFPRALWIGTGGTITVRMKGEEGTVNVPYVVASGTLLPIQVKQVRSTGTTASDIVGLY